MGKLLTLCLLAMMMVTIPVSALAESSVTTLLVVPTGKLNVSQYYSPYTFVSVVTNVHGLNATVTLYASMMPLGFVNGEVVMGALMNGANGTRPEFLTANVSALVVKNIVEYFLKHGATIVNSTNSSEISYCLSTLSNGRMLLMLYNVSGALVGRAQIVTSCNLSASTQASIRIEVPAQVNGSEVAILWGNTPIAQWFGVASPEPRLSIRVGTEEVLGVRSTASIVPATVVRVGRAGYEEYVSAYVSLNTSPASIIDTDTRAIVLNGTIVLSIAAVNLGQRINVELLPREVDIVINGSSVEVYVPIELLTQFMNDYYRVYVARVGNDLAVVSVRDLANTMRSTVWVVGRNTNVSLNDLISVAMPGALLSPPLSFAAYVASVQHSGSRYELGTGRCISIPLDNGVNLTVCRERFVEIASFDSNLSRANNTYYIPEPTPKRINVPIYLAMITGNGVTISPITVTRTVTTTTTALPSNVATLTRLNIALAIALTALALALIATLALLARRRSAIARY